MTVRFNRAEISSINNTQLNSSKNRNYHNNKQVAIPEEKTFAYILEKAKKGNEMAAVQIDEWHRFCKANNNREHQVLKQINKAVDELFE